MSNSHCARKLTHRTSESIHTCEHLVFSISPVSFPGVTKGKTIKNEKGISSCVKDSKDKMDLGLNSCPSEP